MSIPSFPPPLNKIPFPLVTLTTSLAPAHQFLFACPPPSAAPHPTNSSGGSPPNAPLYPISNTAPLRRAVRTNVCLSANGRRGRVSGREMMCVVRLEGWEWVRHASERVGWVVGRRERMSYVLKKDVLFVVYGMFLINGIDEIGIQGKLTRPNPFSLSASRTMVSRLRYIMPGRGLSCLRRGSRWFLSFFGSTLV